MKNNKVLQEQLREEFREIYKKEIQEWKEILKKANLHTNGNDITFSDDTELTTNLEMIEDEWNDLWLKWLKFEDRLDSVEDKSLVDKIKQEGSEVPKELFAIIGSKL